MFSVLEKLIVLATEAIKARGDAQLLAEIEIEVTSLRRALNDLKDYRDRREVEDQALLLLGEETEK